MNTKKHITLIIIVLLIAAGKQAYAQTDTLTLDKAINAALQNNRLLNIKKLQVEEKQAKVKEDEIKRYPTVILSSTYLYNVNTSDPLPFNSTTAIPIPIPDKYTQIGEHNTFNAAGMIYQPITQQGKIRTGISISKTDALITEKEKKKLDQQIRQSVERLFYGLLITEKQKVEASSKLEVAKIKLHDVESALLAGKTVNVDKAGLLATIAEQEQTILQLNIRTDDYMEDLKQVTGLTNHNLFLAKVDIPASATPSLEESKTVAFVNNVDVNIAKLNQAKADLGITAARQSYLPDVGVVGGYFYQTGNSVFPSNNPFVGINFKWNIQDVIANKHVVTQRELISRQAYENLANTREQLNTDLTKAYNKIVQIINLIAVAQKAAYYRKEELKIQLDKSASGLNTKVDVLNAQSSLAKSEADLYAAQLSYRLAVSDLKILEGK
jgi:outer membrane protein TolC